MFRKKIYNFIVEVQLDEDNKPCVCGLYLKTLKKLSTESRSYKKAKIEAYNKAFDLYPEYKNYLYLEDV